jgi:hypothetical protein
MSELLSKISSYNIFNYLFPGAVFASIAKWLGLVAHPIDDVATLLLLYVAGMTLSRVGSLIVEPVLKRLKFVRYADYKRFVAASKSDSKIDILVEVSNTYRTLCAGFIVLLFWYTFDRTIILPDTIRGYGPYLILAVLSVLYIISFKKQADYVKKRIELEK